MKKNIQISCPKCGHKFNVEDVLAHQIEEKYKDELNQKISEIESDYKAKEELLSKKEQELKQKQSEIEEQVEERLKLESEKRAKEIKKEVEKDFESKIKLLSEENEDRKNQIQKLGETKIENEKLKEKFKNKNKFWRLN